MSLLPELLRRLARAAHDKNEDIVDETLVRLCKWSGWAPQAIDYMARMEPRLQLYVNERIKSATSSDVARLMAAMSVEDDYHGSLPFPRHGDHGTPRASMTGVTQDATSLKYVPSTSGQWTTTMAAAGLATGNPGHAWLHQDASAGAADAIGTDTMAVVAADPLYQQAKAGWTRVGEVFVDGSANALFTSATYASSTLFLAYIGLTGTPGASRTAIYAQGALNVETTRAYTGGAADAGTTVRPVVVKTDRTGSVRAIYTDQETYAPAYASVTNGVGYGSLVSSSAPMWVGYSALWTGASAELSNAQIKTLLQTLGWTVAW